MPDATDLGYLLHKHPGRVQRFDVAAGVAHVFYPEASADRCTVAVQVELDPIDLVRGRRWGGDVFALGQYVNDRPYAGSSMLAVALGKVFRTALSGRCEARPDLVGQPLDLEVHVPAVPTPDGPSTVGELFEPLGWDVSATPVALDTTLPEWGMSRYVDLRLRGRTTLAAALSHLYVLLPVLDGSKHYWVSQDEVDKLVRAAGDWLPTHPMRDFVTRRYLARQRDLVSSATARLDEIDDRPADDVVLLDAGESTRPLAGLRREAVVAQLRRLGVARVVDLGCGEGALLRDLLARPEFTEVVGADVSARALQQAERRLGLDRMPDTQRARLRLLQSSVTYRDTRLTGFDAIVLSEVIEHLDLGRLPALEAAVLGHARPRHVVVTTPNAEHNVRYPHLPPGAMRHPDHRFEWTRGEFGAWAAQAARQHGYTVELSGVGDDDPVVGPPTQVAVLTRGEAETSSEAGGVGRG